jgi:phosphoglycolate phosphatase-like HAD superfamily hydrolase
MTKIKAVLFDLDGTLVDTFLDLYDATNYSMTKTHNPTRTESEIKSFVGRGVNNLLHHTNLKTYLLVSHLNQITLL